MWVLNSKLVSIFKIAVNKLLKRNWLFKNIEFTETVLLTKLFFTLILITRPLNNVNVHAM